jgi:hypothetical protein
VQKAVTVLRRAHAFSNDVHAQRLAVAAAVAQLTQLLQRGGWPPEAIERLLADPQATGSQTDALEMADYFSSSSSSSGSSSSDSGAKSSRSSSSDDNTEIRYGWGTGQVLLSAHGFKSRPRMTGRHLPFGDFKVSHTLLCHI